MQKGFFKLVLKGLLNSFEKLDAVGHTKNLQYEVKFAVYL